MRRPSFSRFSALLATLCAFSTASAQTPENPATVTISFEEADLIYPEGSADQTVEVVFTLSNRFFADVTIPFSINPASTATYRLEDENGDRGDGDYFITEDTDDTDENRFLFDPETLSGSITFIFGETRRSFEVTINNDFLADGEATEQLLETIIFDIDQSAFIPEALGSHLTHTLIIQDDDTPSEFFPEWITFERNQRYEVTESSSIRIPLRLRSRIPEATELIYSVSFSGDSAASAEDFPFSSNASTNLTYDPENDDNVDFTGRGRATIVAGSTVATIVIPALLDTLDEGTENFFVHIDSLSINNADSDNDGRTFTTDSEPVEVFIVDAEDTSAEPTLAIDLSAFDDDFASEIELRRTQFISLPLTLSAIYAETIYVPIGFSGDAVPYDADAGTGDYTTTALEPTETDTVNNLPDFYVRILSGDLTANLSIVSESDTTVTKFLDVKIGDDTDPKPFYIVTADDDTQTKVYIELTTGTDLLSSYRVNFKDEPIEVGFGRSTFTLNSDIESDDVLTRSTRSVVRESVGSFEIPIYLSSAPDDDESYRVEAYTLDGDNPAGNEIKLFDSSVPFDEQEDWDVRIFVDNNELSRLGDTVDATARDLNSGGLINYQGNTVTVIVNNDDEDPIPYDQFINYVSGNYTGPEDSPNNFEPYEQRVRLRLTKIDDNSPEVVADAGEYEIVIRELPDIELTAAYTADQLRPSAPVLNPLSGLHEAKIDFTPPTALNPILTALNSPVPDSESAEDTYLAGYRAYKMTFRTDQWDQEDLEGSDPLVTKLRTGSAPNGFIDEAFVPNRINPFYYEVQRPFALRLPSAMTPVVLLEGVDRPSGQLRFEEENADTLAFRDELFVPLALFDIDPDTEIGNALSGGYYRSIIPTADEMAFTLEFTNNGEANLDISRLDEAGAVRVFLSSESVAFSAAAAGFIGTIYSVQEMQDGSQRTYLDLGLPGGTSVDANAISIEYLTEDGEWIPAQPGQIRKIGSEFIWIDQGPPATWPHPKDVNMRLYRISSLSN